LFHSQEPTSETRPLHHSNRRLAKSTFDVALLGIEREATSFLGSLTELTPNQWDAIVTLDRTNVDPHWIVRHAVHDSNHHLLDIERLRLAL
jgi:hypothetical protein